MSLLSAGLTDIGMKRKSNQDAIYLNQEKKIFVVADGMGGHNGGDIASAMAVKYIPEYMLEHFDEDPLATIIGSIKHANNVIKEKGKNDPDLTGMGTTAVTFLFKGDSVYIGNVGDSRAYLVSRKKLYQMSIDHSLVQEKLNLSILGNTGNYSREIAAGDPQKNIIVRTVGFEDVVDVDVFNYQVNKNDILFMCSDGLHGKVSDRDILHIINSCIPDPTTASRDDLQNTVKKLIGQANANGGQDNISVVLILAQ